MGTYAAAPAVAAPVAPVTYAAPIAPYVGSQYHAQDEFGNLNYGYSNLNSAKAAFAEAYAAQEAAVAAVAERKKREADPAFSYSTFTQHPGYAAYHPYAGLGYAAHHAGLGYAAYHPYSYGLGPYYG